MKHYWLTKDNALVIFTLRACTPLYSLTSGDLLSRATAAVSSLCGRSGSSFCLHLSKLLQNSNQRLELIRFSWQRTMIQNLIVPLLLSFLTYYYLPAPETNLLGKTNINDRDVVFSNDIIFSCFSVQRWKPFKEHVGENWKIEVSTNIRFLPETLNIIFKFAFPGKFLQTNRNVTDLLLLPAFDKFANCQAQSKVQSP